MNFFLLLSFSISINHRYNSKLTLLALPSVIYEPRFRGSIRNLVYADQPNVPARRQEMRQPRDIKVSIDLLLYFYHRNGSCARAVELY